MQQSGVKENSAEEQGSRRKNRRKLVPLFVIAVPVLLYILFGSRILCNIAGELAEDGKYEKAQVVIFHGVGSRCRQTEKYIELRSSLNKLVLSPTEDGLLSLESALDDIDTEKLMSEEASQLEKISRAIGYIHSAVGKYDSLSDEMNTVFAVFLEYNRLHTDNGGAGNTAFIPRDEFAFLSACETSLSKVENFAKALNNYEKVYLFSYFIKEAHCEIVDLRDDMDELFLVGYGLDDMVRYSSSSHKAFSVINKGNINITLTEGEQYAEIMRLDTVSYIISDTLAEYYILGD